MARQIGLYWIIWGGANTVGEGRRRSPGYTTACRPGCFGSHAHRRWNWENTISVYLTERERLRSVGT